MEVYDEPVDTNRTVGGVENRVLTGDQKIKLMTTGAGGGVIFHEGPPVGKKWTIQVILSVKESDV
jgi:hypothetical protein